MRQFQDSGGLFGNVRASAFCANLCNFGSNVFIFIASMCSDSFDKILQRLLEDNALKHVAFWLRTGKTSLADTAERLRRARFILGGVGTN